VMAWLSILQLLLQLAAQFAQRAERADIEKAVLDALKLSHDERVDRAHDARDSVLSGRVPPDDGDPNRRD
jgi:hypothetical protein